MFVIQELPFFVLFIIILLPLTIGIILFLRIIELFRGVISKRKQKESISLITFGEILVYLTIFGAIINIVLYLIGDQPSDFSIFEYLIEDTLPLVWYMLLLYGILIQLSIMLGRRSNG